jgi:hypothetical protein
MQIVWDEPAVNALTGRWEAAVRNLRRRSKDSLARHELCGYMAMGRDDALVAFRQDVVSAWGVQRCWWFLREEIVERVVLLAPEFEAAMDAALDRASPVEDAGDDSDDEWGELSWC